MFFGYQQASMRTPSRDFRGTVRDDPGATLYRIRSLASRKGVADRRPCQRRFNIVENLLLPSHCIADSRLMPPLAMPPRGPRRSAFYFTSVCYDPLRTKLPGSAHIEAKRLSIAGIKSSAFFQRVTTGAEAWELYRHLKAGEVKAELPRIGGLAALKWRYQTSEIDRQRQVTVLFDHAVRNRE
jgi:hypothetical protein